VAGAKKHPYDVKGIILPYGKFIEIRFILCEPRRCEFCYRQKFIQSFNNRNMKLGFIGLGHLGTPIAENLLGNTKQLYVYNRTVAKAQDLTEKGAVLCKSVKELASLCDIVFSIVSDDAALKQITTGNEGVAANLKAGGIHVCISTILPATAKELSALHRQIQ
jgi:lactate dehydrogenase-like 2-hydroxyacid dehydrogenase